MKKEDLLEKITGEKHPKFVNERENVIIEKCLTIINNLETNIPTLDYWMLNIITEALQKEYDYRSKDRGLTKVLSKVVDKEGLARAKEVKAEIDSNKWDDVGQVACAMKRIDEIKEAISQECYGNMSVNGEKIKNEN